MAFLEDQAQFLVAKYGTPLGPTGLPHAPITYAAPGLDPAGVLVILGLLILAFVLTTIVRDAFRAREVRARERERLDAIRDSFGA